MTQDDTDSVNGTHGTKRSFLLVLIIVVGICFLALMLTSAHYGYLDALYFAQPLTRDYEIGNL
jgi:hypothetical protein